MPADTGFPRADVENDFLRARRRQVLSRLAQRLRRDPDDDNLILPFLELGGVGGVCVHTHVCGPQVKEMVRLFKQGDHVEARRLDEATEPAYELLKVQANPIAIKAALNILGHEVGGVRLPLVEANEDEQARVRDCLDRLGVLAPA